MKEAFWGVLIVLLGLFGIVVVNIFQNVTVDNDRVYYLIKESTEASAYDALDLTYYRLSGKLRIAEDKFVENLTRRFAENVTIGDYRIVVEDINEMPPKISLRVRSGVTSLRGEKFGIVNRVDGILETKYKLDEVLDFLGITKEEWDRAEGSAIEKDDNTGENICKVITDNKDEIECIMGDIKFAGFEDADVVESVCQDETPSGTKERKVKYKVCDCGKWVEESETLSASPVKVGNEWVYTWTFNKIGEIRTISETLKSRVRIDVCTTSIGEMVPKDIGEAKPKEDGSAHEPSKDNSSYMACPAGGIKIPIGMKFIMHPNYIPKESVNRNLEWSTIDSSIVVVQGSNPASTCWLNKEGTNCFSRATITAKEVGTAYVNVETLNVDGMTKRGQTATCKVEVFDGKVESIGCKDLNIQVGNSDTIVALPNPKNSTITNYEYSISDSGVAIISGNAVMAKAGGTATITIKETNTGKTGTCTVTVPRPPEPPKTYSDYDGTGGASSKGGYWKLTDASGKMTYYSSYEKARAACDKDASCSYGDGGKISYKNSGANQPEILYSVVKNSNPDSMSFKTDEILYNGNKEPLATTTEIKTHDTKGQTTTTTKVDDKVSGKTTTTTKTPTQTKVEVADNKNKTPTGAPSVTTTVTSNDGSRKVYVNGMLVSSSSPSSGGGSSSGGGGGGSSSSKSSGKVTAGNSKNTVVKTSGSTTKVYVNGMCVHSTSAPKTTSKSGGCFEAGTKVLTIDGYKDIDKLKIGDMVLSYNVDTNENEYKMVTKLYEHNNVNEELYSLNINNKILKVTGKHRFYVKTNYGYEWISAEELKVGDLVMDSNGNYYPIRRIASRTIIENVYNIEVEDNHNYYVSRDNILVHNKKTR